MDSSNWLDNFLLGRLDLAVSNSNQLCIEYIDSGLFHPHCPNSSLPDMVMQLMNLRDSSIPLDTNRSS